MALGRGPKGEAEGVGRSFMPPLTSRALISASLLGVDRSPMSWSALGEGRGSRLPPAVAHRLLSRFPPPSNELAKLRRSCGLLLLLDISPGMIGLALFSGICTERFRLKRAEAFRAPPPSVSIIISDLNPSASGWLRDPVGVNAMSSCPHANMLNC
jgi:hypothetical protein